MAKTWLITGSSRGLGHALAEAVLDAGDDLVATARNTNGLEDLADRYPAQVILWPLDVTNYLAAEAAVNAAVERKTWRPTPRPDFETAPQSPITLRAASVVSSGSA